MKLLIDTNVILDMVLKHSGCSISMELFRKVKETEVSAYIGASSVTDIFYIIHKETHDIDQTYTVMESIFRLVAANSLIVSRDEKMIVVFFCWHYNKRYKERSVKQTVRLVLQLLQKATIRRSD